MLVLVRVQGSPLTNSSHDIKISQEKGAALWATIGNCTEQQELEAGLRFWARSYSCAHCIVHASCPIFTSRVSWKSQRCALGSIGSVDFLARDVSERFQYPCYVGVQS